MKAKCPTCALPVRLVWGGEITNNTWTGGCNTCGTIVFLDFKEQREESNKKCIQMYNGSV
jgi:hypothetical protein